MIMYLKYPSVTFNSGKRAAQDVKGGGDDAGRCSPPLFSFFPPETGAIKIRFMKRKGMPVSSSSVPVDARLPVRGEMRVCVGLG